MEHVLARTVGIPAPGASGTGSGRAGGGLVGVVVEAVLRGSVLCLLLCGFLVLVACDDGGTEPNPELEGGVLATFDVQGETFRLWTTNPATVEDLFALRAGSSQANIPNGPLLSGPGRGDHNLPWSWHLDPAETVMAENTIEVCDGKPSFVEEDLSYWLDLGRYCPWSAELVALQDYR